MGSCKILWDLVGGSCGILWDLVGSCGRDLVGSCGFEFPGNLVGDFKKFRDSTKKDIEEKKIK